MFVKCPESTSNEIVLASRPWLLPISGLLLAADAEVSLKDLHGTRLVKLRV